jgi:carbon monoxide dehydrogenase subunit G
MVAIDVRNPREQVFDFLDVMANHEPFTDHMLADWQYSGPARGVGSKARVRATLGGGSDAIDIEVISAQAPEQIVERNIGAGGGRVGHGTYTLEQLPDGGTRITFQYAWQRAPLSERLAAPLVRAIMRRGNRRAMRRLAERLAALPPGEAPVNLRRV